MSKTTAIGLLFVVIAAGLTLGLARDLYSTERAVLKGAVVAIDAGGQAFESPLLRGPA